MISLIWLKILPHRRRNAATNWIHGCYRTSKLILVKSICLFYVNINKVTLKPQTFLIASSNEQFFIKVYTILYIPKMRRTRRSIIMLKYNLAWIFRAEEAIGFALLGIVFYWESSSEVSSSSSSSTKKV